MDITHLFKASVMAVKLQRKSELPVPDKKRILQKTQRDEFSKQVKEVCHKITTLRNVLLENRSAYMRIGQHLKNASHMTDEQRDLIDRESEKFVNYYTQFLAQMRADWKKIKRKSKQQQEHMECVLDLLGNYLKSVHQIYQQQRKYRVQHELETYRLLKLAADKQKIPVRPAGEIKRKSSIASSQTDHDSSSEESTCTSDIEDDDDDADGEWQTNDRKSFHSSSPKSERRTHRTQKTPSKRAVADSSTNDIKTQLQTSQKVALDEDIQKSQQLVDDEAQTKTLSAEDVQMFEEENMQLYQELQGLSEEVERIGKNVVDIAQLQDIFTEKVSMQQQNIERIANAVVGATENVKDANEQIKQAIQRNAGLRVWSLFFLLVMSFTLLFLDWYYD